MPVLIDYRCVRCGGVSEARVTSPPPTLRTCPACGADARRLFAAATLVGGAASRPAVSATDAADTDSGRPPLCLRYRDVPGLCHMTPQAARRWVALARGDNRALDRELRRQEVSAAAGTPGPALASHHHARDRAAPPEGRRDRGT